MADNSIIRVENLENLEQFAPETQTTDRVNENPNLVEEGKKYQRNGAQQLYEDIIR